MCIPSLAGGVIGKLRDGDQIHFEIDRNALIGSVNFIDDGEHTFTPDERRHLGGCVDEIAKRLAQ